MESRWTSPEVFLHQALSADYAFHVFLIPNKRWYAWVGYTIFWDAEVLRPSSANAQYHQLTIEVNSLYQYHVSPFVASVQATYVRDKSRTFLETE